MAASYPGTIKTFSTKAPGEAIASSHINDLQNEIVAVETQLGVNAGTWQDWTPSSQTGWTALPTGVYRYCQVGKLVHCIIAITAGTSNNTKAEIALPIAGGSSTYVTRGTWGWAQDNGVQVNPAGGYVLNGTTIKFFKTSIDNAAWTATGTKRIYCAFFYEAA